jgi:hypothetical protein
MIMRKVRPLTFSPGPGPYHLRGSITRVERERGEVACATGLVNATFAHVLAAECLTFSPGPGLGRGSWHVSRDQGLWPQIRSNDMLAAALAAFGMV